MINKAEIIKNAAPFVREAEGFRDHSYIDSGGKLTYGYGFTYTPRGLPVQKGMSITKAEADEYLNKLLSDILSYLVLQFGDKMADNKYSALISLIYNIGLEAFKKSHLLQLLKQTTDYWQISTEWKKWQYDNGKSVAGLLRRRYKEIELFFKTEQPKLNL